VINEGTIYLLLVDSCFQGQGIGTSLLKESEEIIGTGGFDKITLGVGSDYIVPGVPMVNNAHRFFEKHGYYHSWEDMRCIDLSISLDDFHSDEYKPGDTVDGILYRFANENDKKGIFSCCKEDAEDFIEYYSNDELYEPDSSDPVLVAEINGEIVAALMIGVESKKRKLGYAGSIITSPRHRGKGIATNILKTGTSHMKNIGLKNIWLSYTYSEILNIYTRIGYKVCMEYFMGEKCRI